MIRAGPKKGCPGDGSTRHGAAFRAGEASRALGPRRPSVLFRERARQFVAGLAWDDFAMGLLCGRASVRCA
jgi:hypothetical protein